MTIWNPDEAEEGFVPAERLIETGDSYTITAVAEVENRYNPDQPQLQVTLENEDEEEMTWFMRPSRRRGSKWITWLESLDALGVKLGGPDDMVGLKFKAHKDVTVGQFRDRDNPTGPMVDREVITITASAIDGATPAEAEAAADDDEVKDHLVEIANGKVFSGILTASADDPILKPVRKQIQNKSLLGDLIDEGRLVLEGRTYKAV